MPLTLRGLVFGFAAAFGVALLPGRSVAGALELALICTLALAAVLWLQRFWERRTGQQ